MAILLPNPGSIEVLMLQRGGHLTTADSPVSPPLSSAVLCCQIGMQLIG